MGLQESSTGNSTNIQSPDSESQSKPIQPFQPQSIKELDSINPHQKIQIGLQQLQQQAAQINQLAIQLETAIWEFKETATQVNENRYWLHLLKKKLGKDKFPDDICEYRLAMLPKIEQISEGSYVLKSYPLNLFLAQKEAHLLARKLRQRYRRKLRRAREFNSGGN